MKNRFISCVGPLTKILMSDGSYMEAANLQPGMLVSAKEPTSFAEGTYQIKSVTVERPPVMSIQFDHVNFVCSTMHTFFMRTEIEENNTINHIWFRAEDLKVGDIVGGHTVLSITNNNAIHSEETFLRFPEDATELEIQKGEVYEVADLIRIEVDVVGTFIAEGMLSS